MQLIDRNSVLWAYLAGEIKGLIVDGELLLDHAGEFTNGVSDFSFLVFPFSKAYEGFLKRLFLDLRLIREDDYFSDDIRIGRILNPGYVHEHTSVYKKICLHQKTHPDLSNKLWYIWKKARNQVFHYFPHNFRKLSYNEALELIREIIGVMEITVTACKL